MTEKASRQDSVYAAQAKDVLRNKVPRPNDTQILELAKRLKEEKAFGYARKLLELAHAAPDRETDERLRLKLAQQQALCTYKDPDLPVSDRLDRALRILDAADALRDTRNQETLGLAGAIFKRKWEAGGQKPNLEQSLYYYLRGYQQGPADDQGYTGINAAYIMDQLAGLEARQAQSSGTTSKIADERWQQARQIRTDLAERLPDMPRCLSFSCMPFEHSSYRKAILNL